MGWMSLVVAIIAAAAAIASWRAAVAANKTSKQLVGIERERRRRELTPTFTLDLDDTTGIRSPVRLTVRLTGPLDLGQVDALTLHVRDDTIDHTPHPGSAITVEEVAAQIWGPYRLTPRVDGATDDGRTVGPFPLKVGDDRPVQIEWTTPPPWANPDAWRRQYTGANVPIRLLLHCEADRYEWDIPAELDVPASLDFY